jgi:glycosyltransferase involved in cell wall biosynthesis
VKLRIRHIVAPDASEYERKSRRIDAAGLSEKFEVVEGASDLVHVYGTPGRMTVPYVASKEPKRGLWRRPQPRALITPFNVPEAVEESYFSGAPPAESAALHTLGTFLGSRRGVRNQVEQTLARIHRFRDDIAWNTYNNPPTLADLRDVDVWVDPAIDDEDFDGFTAEAIVAGKGVVAARTPINDHRLEKGRTGFVVPRTDPNELAHAILAALFKSEVARLKIEAARQTVGKFRPRQRLRVLEQVYEAAVK